MLEDAESLRNPRPANDNDDIGYGKPPTAQQFKPGQSGNAKGRPKGSKNKLPNFGVEQLKSTFLAEAYRDIEVHEGYETMTIPKVTAIIRKMVDKAAAGDIRAAQSVTKMVQGIERENRLRLEENIQIAADYRKYWYDDATYRERVGLSKRVIHPEPHNVSVNFESGDIEVTGVLSKDEQAQLKQSESDADAAPLQFPTKILARGKDGPSGFWHGQFLFRKPPIELPSDKDLIQEQDDEHHSQQTPFRESADAHETAPHPD